MPARAPEIAIVAIIAAETEIPAVRAALEFAPTARNLKPIMLRFNNHQINTAAAKAIKIPIFTR